MFGFALILDQELHGPWKSVPILTSNEVLLTDNPAKNARCDLLHVYGPTVF